MATAELTPDALDEDEQEAVEHLLYRLADDEFVLAERYTEWQVRSPTLESDLAVANIAQDELGHARLWYDLLEDFGYEEEDLIWERPPGEWRHSTLAEQPWPEGGWADAIVRGYLYDVAEDLRLGALEDSTYGRIRDRVGKVQGEEDYHLEHARNWLERLAEDEDGEEPRSSGDASSARSERREGRDSRERRPEGAVSGRERVQAAVDRQFPHALTLFSPTDEAVEERIVDLGLRTRSLAALREDWLDEVVDYLESLGIGVNEADLPEQYDVHHADLPLPEHVGRDGSHTDDWFDLYDEFTETYDELGVSEPARIMKDPDDE